MTELRRQMDDDMVVRGMANRTRETYLAAVTGLAKYYRRSPDQISDEEVQAYLLHLIRDRHRAWNTCHIVVHGLRFSAPVRGDAAADLGVAGADGLTGSGRSGAGLTQNEHRQGEVSEKCPSTRPLPVSSTAL